MQVPLVLGGAVGAILQFLTTIKDARGQWGLSHGR